MVNRPKRYKVGEGSPNSGHAQGNNTSNNNNNNKNSNNNHNRNGNNSNFNTDRNKNNNKNNRNINNNQRGVKQKEELHLDDDSITESQENELLRMTPPLISSPLALSSPSSPSLSNLPHSPNHSATENSQDLLEFINELKEEIISLKQAFHELKEEDKKNKNEIAELKNKLSQFENNNNNNNDDSSDTPRIGSQLTQLSEIRDSIRNIAEAQDQLQQENLKHVVVLSGDEIIQGTEHEDCEQAVINTIANKLNIDISPGDISDAYRLGKKPDDGVNDRRPIRFKINKPNLKSKLTQEMVKKKLSLYLNEFLSPLRKKLLQRALRIRKEHRNLIHTCYFNNGVLIIKRSQNTEPVKVKNERELDNYLVSVNFHP